MKINNQQLLRLALAQKNSVQPNNKLDQKFDPKTRQQQRQQETEGLKFI